MSCININGESVPLSDVSQTAATYWDKLTKKGRGFKFNKSKPLLFYVDEAMTEVYGEPNSNWTVENLKKLKDKIKGNIEEDMGPASS